MGPTKVFNHICKDSKLDNIKQRHKQAKKRFSLLTVEGSNDRNETVNE